MKKEQSQYGQRKSILRCIHQSIFCKFTSMLPPPLPPPAQNREKLDVGGGGGGKTQRKENGTQKT